MKCETCGQEPRRNEGNDYVSCHCDTIKFCALCFRDTIHTKLREKENVCYDCGHIERS